MLELTLAVRSRVNVDAFDEHLTKGSRLWEFSPGQGHTVQSDAALFLRNAANHHLKKTNSQRVDILKHQGL